MTFIYFYARFQLHNMYLEGEAVEYYSNYYESRQHLNLSELAFEIIENDKSAFLEKSSRQRIINMILRNYMDSADIWRRCFWPEQ